MKSDISGFPEFMPNEQITFNRLLHVIRGSFESYGFVPMDTPAVEKVETLLSKGDDNEIYGLYRLTDPESKKDLGLRFDLTVPTARYVASKFGNLVFPYKRYQIAPVWRGERPQSGRYRQFYQCDIDVLGDGSLSVEYDAEIIKVLTETLRTLGLPAFSTRINNRKILYNFLKTIIEEPKINDLIRLIDKIDKISSEEFGESLVAMGLKKQAIEKLSNFLIIKHLEHNDDILKWLRAFSLGPEFSEGVAELENTVTLLKKCDIDDRDIHISMSLARGLSYYTGNVFETTFDNTPGIGSIAAGGRYDNLVSLFSDKKVPGVGASIGITRLAAKMFERNFLKCDRSSTAELLVTVQNRNFISSYMKLADKFRKLGVNTEIYLQDKSLGHQLSYASRKGIKSVLIANEVELLEEKAILRNLDTKEQETISTKYMDKKIAKKIKG